MSSNSDYFDIVHANCYHAFPALYAAQTKSSNKLVFTPHYHGTGHTFFRSILHRPYKFVAKGIFEKADHVICVSKFEKNLVRSRFTFGSKIDVIPNGVNKVEFEGLQKRTSDHNILLYVGRLERYKGVQFIIKSLAKLGSNFFLNIVMFFINICKLF